MDLTDAITVAGVTARVRAREDAEDLLKQVAGSGAVPAGRSLTLPGPPLGIFMRPVEALHLLSLVTAHAYRPGDLHDAYAWWGLLRYLGFFDHKAGDGPQPTLRVSDVGGQVTGAQRRVASEELGIAFGVLLASAHLLDDLDPGVPVGIVDVDLGGLLSSMSVLDGAGFRAAGLDQAVRHFYEHTACWRMEAWAQSALFQPSGELVSRLFGRRVQQLALPTRPLDVACGMDSGVVHLMDASGEQYAAGWLRTLPATGEFVYSGCYSARLLPASGQPSVHVAFPLESGSVQVFLRPSVQADGSLVLSSPSGVFGGDGAYVTVRDGRDAYAARVPIHERFHVYRDHRGVLRTDHELRLYRALVLRLHYRMEPA